MLLLSTQQEDLYFTKGWLWNFQNRWSLTLSRLHGEAAQIVEEDIAEHGPCLAML